MTDNEDEMSRIAHRDNLLNWLDAQFPGRLGALTGTDVDVLCAAEAVANLWLRNRRQSVAAAFAACVRCMQTQTQHYAFHVVAFQGDWDHRLALWEAAQLQPLDDAPAAVWSPQGDREARARQ